MDYHFDSFFKMKYIKCHLKKRKTKEETKVIVKHSKIESGFVSVEFDGTLIHECFYEGRHGSSMLKTKSNSERKLSFTLNGLKQEKQKMKQTAVFVGS